MEYVIDLFFGIVGSLLAAELYCWAPHIARKFIEQAVLRLPESEKERFQEEWFAHLDECPGGLAKLWHSIGCLSCAATMTGTTPKSEWADSSETGTIAFLRLIDSLAKATKEAFNLTPHLRSSFYAPQGGEASNLDLSNYYILRRVIDVIASAALLVALLPLSLFTACLVLSDVGVPVLFWQQRVGLHGRKFLLYKFRTYHAPFDKSGVRTPEERRLSKLGRAIRAGRLDEIPQLLNVLVGDMSLIGPRPLLPVDQPSDPRLRLSVRPGIIGWARINGGTRVTPVEEDALDDWYIRHASFWLDLKIAASAALFAITGQRKNLSAPARERFSFRRVLRRLWRRLK